MRRKYAAAFAIALALAVAHGSSSAAARTRLAIGGTGAAQGTVELLADGLAAQAPELDFYLPRSLGSSGGVKAVAAGALDIGTSGRPLKEQEKRAGLVEHAFASTPFIIVTSHPTFRDNLSNAEVVSIFALSRTEWPDGSMIRPVLRPESDADTAFLKAHFPGMAGGLDATRKLQLLPIAKTDQDNLDAAEGLPGSFAATSLAAVVSESRNLAVLPLDGVAPSLETIESGAYKYVKTLYFVTRESKSPAVRRFLAFVASSEGARILRGAGSLPLPIVP